MPLGAFDAVIQPGSLEGKTVLFMSAFLPKEPSFSLKEPLLLFEESFFLLEKSSFRLGLRFIDSHLCPVFDRRRFPLIFTIGRQATEH